MLYNLSKPGVKDLTLKETPDYITLKVPLFNESRIEGYVRVNSLSPALREQVFCEIEGCAPEVLEDAGELQEQDLLIHKSLDSWLRALVSCKLLSGEVYYSEDSQNRAVTFKHLPSKTLPVSYTHSIGVRFLGGSVSPGVTEKLCMTEEELWKALKTHRGRFDLVTSPLPTKAQDKPDVKKHEHDHLDTWLLALRRQVKDPNLEACYSPDALWFTVPGVRHQVSLASGERPSVGVAALWGSNPFDLYQIVSSPGGLDTLLESTLPDITPMEDRIAVLELSARHRERGQLQFDLSNHGREDVQIPEVPLWEGAPGLLGYISPERAGELQEGREHRSSRPSWVPPGWGRFVLPADADRVGVLGSESTVKTGAFVRRDKVLFRVFDDGFWDKSLLGHFPPGLRPVDARSCPYGLVLQRKRGSPEEALEEVLPLLECEPLGPVLSRYS